GTLEAEQGQSGCGLSADADSASDFLRLLPDVADRHRTARRQFSLGLRSVAGGYRLGHSGTEFSPQSTSAHHGRDPALADAPDAALARRRSRAAEDDAVYAADLSVHPLQFLLRLDTLLDRAKSANHCANEIDQGQQRKSSRAHQIA